MLQTSFEKFFDSSIAFRGELTSHHPHFHPASPAAAKDIDIKTAKQLLPDGFTVGIHMGTWHKPGEPYDAHKVHDDIKYSKEDDVAIDNWISGMFIIVDMLSTEADLDTLQDHVETTWHSLGTCGKITSSIISTVIRCFSQP